MMKCPKCVQNLKPANRQGVEIDVCPTCRGVWLDRGELDKIINRYCSYEDEHWTNDREDHRRHHEPRRRSFWQELFD